jgi:hypothetical protein
MRTSKNSPLELTASSFVRRLGSQPQCASSSGCPDVWELADGNFAIIGLDITDKVAGKLPAVAGCAPGEKVILLPRSLLVNAKRDIPDKV